MMIRRIASRPESVFLTFDDGPSVSGTRSVLDILEKHGAKATFFLIGTNVRSQPDLAFEVVNRGHAIGNHSWDHQYKNYFRGRLHLREWIQTTDREFASQGLPASVGFRPPAGVVIPPLVRAVRDLQEPMILWNERFYDSVFPWTEAKARRSAGRLQGGSIVLLHDRQPASRVGAFCRTLDTYLASLGARGLKCESLTRDLCLGVTS